MYTYVCMCVYDMYVHVYVWHLLTKILVLASTIFTIILYFPIAYSTLGFWL